MTHSLIKFENVDAIENVREWSQKTDGCWVKNEVFKT